MGINCNIEGIFLKANDIPYTSNMTVADVLDAIKANPGLCNADKFGYFADPDFFPASKGGGASVVAFSANYGLGNKPTEYGLAYPEGDYFLSESSINPSFYSVWQYYVENEDRERSRSGPEIRSFSKRTLADGDTVTWRLVSILTGPNRLPRLYRDSETV